MNMIDFKDLSEDEVLFFIRIKGKRQYFNLFYPESFLERFQKIKTHRTISEYSYDADFVIDINKFSISDLSIADYNIIDKVVDITEIVKRCRGLRAIHYHEAKELIFRCSKFFIEFYKEKSSLKLIVAGAVDNYVMDLMFRFAKHFGISCLGITDFFLFPQYKLVTSYGEANKFYEPSDLEINQVLYELENKKPSPLAINKLKAYKNALRYFIGFYYRYIIRYVINYKIGGKLGYEYRFAPHLASCKSIFQLLFSDKYFDKLDIEWIKNNSNSIVYIPLHWYPEATIDYWTDDPEKADYFHLLFRVISFFRDKNVYVILKEHPAFFLSRELDFYKQLKEFNNVILLNPFIKTQYLFEFVNDIVVWNGSTGVEALIAGKNVYNTTESYYSNKKIPSYKQYGASYSLTREEKYEMIKNILQTSLKVG